MGTLDRETGTAHPACQLGTITVHTDHHLFWVMRGSARVMVAEGSHELGTMEALWIPPGVAVDQITTSPGTTALTALLPVEALPGAPRDVVRRRVPPEFTELLLHLYSRWIVPFWRSDGITPDVVAALRGLFFSGPGPLVTAPVVPVSPAAVRVARVLLADPGDPQSLSGFAADAGVSPRHLTRLFIGETGLSFTAWRSRVRMCTAERLLRQGNTVTRTAGFLGYRSAASFSRSFRQVAGIKPGDVVAHGSGAQEASGSRLERVAAAVPDIPAGRLLPIVGSRSVLVWAARGSAVIRFRDGAEVLSPGEVMWLPAGVRHEVETAPGGVLVPVGSVPAEVPMVRGDAVPFHPGESWQNTLLYRSAVNHTRLRPHVVAPLSPDRWAAGDCHDLLPDGVRDRVSGRCSAAVTRILEADVGPVAVSTSVGRWSRRFGVQPRQLDAELQRRTGDRHRRWLLERRMSVARSLLRAGSSVADVAVRTGYTAAPAFVRTFGEHHGMTPGEFRRRYLTHVVFDVVE